MAKDTDLQQIGDVSNRLYHIVMWAGDISNRRSYFLFVGENGDITFQVGNRHSETYIRKFQIDKCDWPIQVGQPMPIFTEKNGNSFSYCGNVGEITQLHIGDDANGCELFHLLK